MRYRKNISIDPAILSLAWAVQTRRKIDKVSQLLATLIREEYERCGEPPIPLQNPFQGERPGLEGASPTA